MLFFLPTNTCYGLAGSFTKDDFDTINTLKGRDDTKMLTFLVENFYDIEKYVVISPKQREFLMNYPYPWSFLGDRNPDFSLPSWLDTKKYDKICLRVASVCIKNYGNTHDFLFLHGQNPYKKKKETNMRECLSWHEIFATGPLFLTSANVSGQHEATTLSEAQKYFPQISGIDGGHCNGLPSDIFSLGEMNDIRYLRQNYGYES